MAKSFKTIYFSSELMLKAESQNVDINAICEEALRIAVNSQENSGTTAGALGNFLNAKAEKANDLKVLKRMSGKRDEAFNKALRAYCIKYELQLSEALKELGI